MPTIAITKTTGWINVVRNGFAGSDNPKISYVAVGSGTTTPSSSDTQLAAETFRKAVTTYTAGGNGELLVSMFLGPSDLVGGDIEEVGLFAGSGATNTPNSGVLIGRGLWSHPSKSGSESITLTLDATVS
jgi:hypothetical protein